MDAHLVFFLHFQDPGLHLVPRHVGQLPLSVVNSVTMPVLHYHWNGGGVDGGLVGGGGGLALKLRRLRLLICSLVTA